MQAESGTCSGAVEVRESEACRGPGHEGGLALGYHIKHFVHLKQCAEQMLVRRAQIGAKLQLRVSVKLQKRSLRKYRGNRLNCPCEIRGVTLELITSEATAMADACAKSGRSAVTCGVRGLSLPLRPVQTFLVETQHSLQLKID
ncbi:hypothetical protein EVAR_51245_1 [Eumeta japonica]|uniref:Uncharacterized protein n=1 Tax=Eumeta variegata TaxID=151549 RepID=A0A4C1X0X0_EUMVA|nr:hypothetical protein EVAR_51245_1 [Eumeta japonica]